MIELSLLVPCLNEEGNLDELVARVAALPMAASGALELLLVDDGSRDGTWAAIERLRRGHPFVASARHQHNHGIPAAWQTAALLAKGQLVCVLDADLQYRPEDVPRLHAELLSSGADVVQGYRVLAGGLRGVRWALSRGLNALLNELFGMRLRDNKSGFLLLRRTALLALLEERHAFRHFQVLPLVAAHSRGLTIREVATRFEPRRAGHSAFGTLPLLRIAEVALDLLRARRLYQRPR